jgi:hypothetical protein
MNALTARARGLFPAWLPPAAFAPVVRVLAAYAAQNPGLEYGNYCAAGRSDAAGRRAYFAEARGITRQLHRVREAVHCAHAVRDADLVEAAGLAFSGRLSITVDGDRATVAYCTGQYWPTEYRAAVAAVIERAIEIAYARGLDAQVAA